MTQDLKLEMKNDPGESILEEQRFLGLQKKLESGVPLSRVEKIDYDRLQPKYGMEPKK